MQFSWLFQVKHFKFDIHFILFFCKIKSSSLIFFVIQCVTVCVGVFFVQYCNFDFKVFLIISNQCGIFPLSGLKFYLVVLKSASFSFFSKSSFVLNFFVSFVFGTVNKNRVICLSWLIFGFLFGVGCLKLMTAVCL